MPRKLPPRDPNLDHPAVKLYLEICRSTPNHIQRRLIANEIRQLDLYEEILHKFMSEGRPPHRVDWTLERYRNALQTRAGITQKTVGKSEDISPEEEAWMRRRAN